MTKKILLILSAIIIIPTSVSGETAQTKFDQRTGNQNKEYLENSIPSGDALREAIWLITEAQKISQNIVYEADSLATYANALIKIIHSCRNPDSCNMQCREIRGAGDNCSCTPEKSSAEQLCNLQEAEKIYENIKSKNVDTGSDVSSYAKFIGQPFLPTQDIKTLRGTPFLQLESSSLYKNYSDFYKNYNEIIVPKLEKLRISNARLPAKISSQDAVPRLEYIKRKADLSRVFFTWCSTPTITEEDAARLGEGDFQMKSPMRIDFLLLGNVTLPDEPTNILDYFCLSYQNL